MSSRFALRPLCLPQPFLAPLFLLLLGSAPAFAHPAFEAQIQHVEARMAKEPRDGALFLRRARLYLHHQHWDLALRDLDQAKKLGAPGNEIGQVRGMLWMLRGDRKKAVEAFGEALALDPTDVVALIGRGRALRLEGRLGRATQDFERAVKLTGRETPVDVLTAYARTLAAVDDGARAAEAVAVLDRAMKTRGQATTLCLCAIELEVAAGEVDAALSRLDDLIARSPRKEMWLARRGDICVAAGRGEEGRADYALAIKLLEGRRPSRRRVPAILELERSLRQKLNSGEDKG